MKREKLTQGSTEKYISGKHFVNVDGWLQSLGNPWFWASQMVALLILKTSESRMGFSHVESPRWASEIETPIKPCQWTSNQYHKTDWDFIPKWGFLFMWVWNDFTTEGEWQLKIARKTIPSISELHSVAFHVYFLNPMWCFSSRFLLENFLACSWSCRPGVGGLQPEALCRGHASSQTPFLEVHECAWQRLCSWARVISGFWDSGEQGGWYQY